MASPAEITPGMGPQRWALILGALTPAVTLASALALGATRSRDWVLSVALLAVTFVPVGVVSAALCAWHTWRTREHWGLALLLWAGGYALSALVLLILLIVLGQVQDALRP